VLGSIFYICKTIIVTSLASLVDIGTFLSISIKIIVDVATVDASVAITPFQQVQVPSPPPLPSLWAATPPERDEPAVPPELADQATPPAPAPSPLPAL
jgi:hypothetical protein